MRWKLIIKLLSALNAILGAAMFLPLGIALFDGASDVNAFALALAVTLGVNTSAYLITRKTYSDLSHRDGFLVVTLAWASACLFAALPFWFGGYFHGFTDAYFEAVSGFTTTGSTVLTDIAATPRATLFWRSIIQWFGGMGIIVLSLAILPLLGVGGMQMFKAEVPGPTTDKLQPRVRDTAWLLWKVYVLITVSQAVLLMLGGMGGFDAICHSFTTLATGGFGTQADSFVSMHSVYLESVTTLFMFLAGVNFSLHYLTLTGKWKSYIQDGEFRVYALLLLIATLGMAILLRFSGTYDSLWTALRYASFQVVSIMTTTGFNSADFEAWSLSAPLAPLLLFMLMFVGGMAGSTGGGMKVIRLWLLVKHGYREMFRLIHPRAVKHIKINRKVVPETVLDAVIGFFVLYVMLFLFATVVMALFGHDFTTSLSAVAACLNNIGPGLGTVGPMDNFAGLQPIVKWVLIFCMLLGRLEVYTVLLLFVPEFWKK